MKVTPRRSLIRTLLGGYFNYRLRNGVYAYYSDGTFRTYENADTNAFATALITDKVNILISKTTVQASLGNEGSTWGVTYYSNSSTALQDFNGETNTTTILASTSSPLCSACREQFDGTGYLWSLGEYNEINNNLAYVISMISKIGGGNGVSGTWIPTTTLSNNSEYWGKQGTLYPHQTLMRNSGFDTINPIAKIPNY